MRPDYLITVEGNALNPLIADRLVSVRVTDDAGVKSDTCEIVIDNRDGALEVPAEGAVIAISLGYVETGVVQLGTYVVDEVSLGEPPFQLTIRGKAADMTGGLKARRTQSYDGQTIGAIVDAIAARHGLEPAVSADYQSTVVTHIDQRAESDLNFLTRLAGDRGAVAKVIEGKLVFAVSGTAKSVSGQDLPAVTVNRSDCAPWHWTRAKRGEKKVVVAEWHDTGAAEAKTVAIGGSADDDEAHTLSRSFTSEAEARAAAQSEYDDAAKGAEDFSFTTTGNPLFAAEGKVTAVGFGTPIDKDWVIKTVEHSYRPDAYTCAVSCCLVLKADGDSDE